MQIDNNHFVNDNTTSIFSFKLKNSTLILALLILGFALRIWIAQVDPFLHPWDERFHALVARNMMHDPFKPMLKAYPVTNNYDPNVWCCNHIWLHKQPLFMWQMALSMKLFGVSEFTMRLPSVLMGSLLILILYRLAFLFSNNKKIALIAAGLMAFSNFHLQMIGGMHGMDHNDVALGFYVLLSIWAYAEYIRKPKWYWVVLIGLFSGCAILNKWLLGLLVFSGWGLNILLNIKSKNLLAEIRWFLLALMVCCIVFVPWQIYVLQTFPNEARHEFEFNRRHITEALEGHTGSVFYYIENFQNLFGHYLSLFIIGGMIISSFQKSLLKKLHVAFLAEILIVFCFFSFIVKTKEDTYIFFVAPLCFAFSAIAIYHCCLLLRKQYLVLPFLVGILFLAVNPIQMGKYLSKSNTVRNNSIYNASIYRNLGKDIPGNIKLVVNCNAFEDIDVMFYNNNLTAYSWSLPPEDMQLLKEKKTPIAIFDNRKDYNMPDYVASYPYLFVLDKKLREGNK